MSMYDRFFNEKLPKLKGEDEDEDDDVLSPSALALMDDRKWAEEQAQRQMDFQERMSNTSYQRAMADLQKAGLNPALAYTQGGASSAVGAMADTNSSAQKETLQSERMMYSLANSAIHALASLFRIF